MKETRFPVYLRVGAPLVVRRANYTLAEIGARHDNFHLDDDPLGKGKIFVVLKGERERRIYECNGRLYFYAKNEDDYNDLTDCGHCPYVSR